LWFEATANGPHVLVTVIVTDPEPIVLVTFIDVGGEPDPEPDPHPIPPPGPRKIVVIIERSDPIPTPAQAKVLEVLDKWQEAEGYTPETYRVADPDLTQPDGKPAAWLKPYLGLLRARAVQQPALIIDAEPFGDAGGADVVKPLSDTGAEAISVIEEAGG